MTHSEIEYFNKWSLMYFIVALGLCIPILLVDVFCCSRRFDIGGLLLCLTEIIAIIYWLKNYSAYSYLERYPELDFIKIHLENRLVRYNKLVIANWAFQFRLKRNISKLLTRELAYSLGRYTEVKSTSTGTWLIVYRLGFEPKKEKHT